MSLDKTYIKSKAIKMKKNGCYIYKQDRIEIFTESSLDYNNKLLLFDFFVGANVSRFHDLFWVCFSKYIQINSSNSKNYETYVWLSTHCHYTPVTYSLIFTIAANSLSPFNCTQDKTLLLMQEKSKHWKSLLFAV